MARMPACFTLSGVGKSGSPGPKSTTSMPCSRSLIAASITAMVFDTEMREIRVASFITLFLFLESLFQTVLDDLGDQPSDGSAEFRNFLHQPRTEIGIVLCRRHKHG